MPHCSLTSQHLERWCVRSVRLPRQKQELIAKPLERKAKQLGRIKGGLWKKPFKLKLQPMGLKEKQSLEVAGGAPRATASSGESGRPTEGAEQGRATALSDRVNYFSDEKLDCGRLSVEPER